MEKNSRIGSNGCDAFHEAERIAREAGMHMAVWPKSENVIRERLALHECVNTHEAIEFALVVDPCDVFLVAVDTRVDGLYNDYEFAMQSIADNVDGDLIPVPHLFGWKYMCASAYWCYAGMKWDASDIMRKWRRRYMSKPSEYDADRIMDIYGEYTTARYIYETRWVEDL